MCHFTECLTLSLRHPQCRLRSNGLPPSAFLLCNEHAVKLVSRGAGGTLQKEGVSWVCWTLSLLSSLPVLLLLGSCDRDYSGSSLWDPGADAPPEALLRVSNQESSWPMGPRFDQPGRVTNSCPSFNIENPTMPSDPWKLGHWFTLQTVLLKHELKSF